MMRCDTQYRTMLSFKQQRFILRPLQVHWGKLLKRTWASCSKLMMLLVNDLLKFQIAILQTVLFFVEKM